MREVEDARDPDEEGREDEPPAEPRGVEPPDEEPPDDDPPEEPPDDEDPPEDEPPAEPPDEDPPEDEPPPEEPPEELPPEDEPPVDPPPPEPPPPPVSGSGSFGGVTVGTDVGIAVGTGTGRVGVGTGSPGVGTGSFGVGTGSWTVGTGGTCAVGTGGSCAQAGVAIAVAATPHTMRPRTRIPLSTRTDAQSPMRFKPEWSRIRETSRMRTRRGIWLGVAVAALLVPAAPATAAPSGVVYGGETKQDWPIVVRLARDGKSVAKVVVALSLACNSGSPIVNKDRYDKLKLSASGRFSDSYGPVTTENGDGTTTDYRGTLEGKLAGGRITGTSRLTGDFYDATGKLVDTCDSFKVTWTARQ